MDIAILNYPTGEVDVIREVSDSLIEAKYEGDVEWYLDDCGYNTSHIHYMCSNNIIINDNNKLYE
jgi:hypothetical protein